MHATASRDAKFNDLGLTANSPEFKTGKALIYCTFQVQIRAAQGNGTLRIKSGKSKTSPGRAGGFQNRGPLKAVISKDYLTT